MFHVYLKYMRPCNRKHVCFEGRFLPMVCSFKQQHFVTNSAGKTLDVIKPENNPKKPVINWASLRENRAKYESMKWAG